MYRLCKACYAVALALVAVQCAAFGQDETSSDPDGLRRELASSRRVGYLRHDDTAKRYWLEDAWDKKTYHIQAAKGLKLEPFKDRYVTLRGQTLGEDGGEMTFLTERVAALDGQRPASGRASEVQRASVDIEIPGDSNRLEDESAGPTARVAALADGLPPPSTVLEELQTPATTAAPPSSYASPLTSGAEWLGFREAYVAQPIQRWWARGEYLWWVTDAMETPPLVTTSPIGAPRADAGVLGEPGTSVLFGGDLNNDPTAGFRFQLGYWLDTQRSRGIDGEILWLEDQTDSFSASSFGDPILARPFFDALNGQDTAQLVAFPNVLRGEVSVDATTEFGSVGLRARLNRCGVPDCDCSRPVARRLDCLIGYRQLRLKDSLVIYEDLVSLDQLNPGLFEITDSFATENDFYGIDVGFVQQTTRGRFSLETITKVAVGTNRQKVAINGFSIIDEAGLVEQFPGGLLAQRTNIGTYTRDELAVVPELSATLGWHINPKLTLTLGYSFIYFSNVVRAGDQIQPDVNTNLLPPEADPFSGPLRPAFAFRETDFWAQGVTLGADYRW